MSCEIQDSPPPSSMPHSLAPQSLFFPTSFNLTSFILTPPRHSPFPSQQTTNTKLTRLLLGTDLSTAHPFQDKRAKLGKGHPLPRSPLTHSRAHTPTHLVRKRLALRPLLHLAYPWYALASSLVKTPHFMLRFGVIWKLQLLRRRERRGGGGIARSLGVQGARRNKAQT